MKWAPRGHVDVRSWCSCYRRLLRQLYDAAGGRAWFQVNLSQTRFRPGAPSGGVAVGVGVLGVAFALVTPDRERAPRFAVCLAACRAEHGYSLAEVAVRLHALSRETEGFDAGPTPKTVWRWEHGVRPCNRYRRRQRRPQCERSGADDRARAAVRGRRIGRRRRSAGARRAARLGAAGCSRPATPMHLHSKRIYARPGYPASDIGLVCAVSPTDSGGRSTVALEP